MRLKAWRANEGLTLGKMTELLEVIRLERGGNPKKPYGVRTIHRYETGESETNALLREDIIQMTSSAVTPIDHHITRLDWLLAGTEKASAA